MKWAESIRAVTFDVGGTLIDPWPSVGQVYAEVAAAHGLTALSPESLNQRFLAAWKGRAPFDYSRQAWLQLVAETFSQSPQQLPSAFFDALYDRFERPDAWKIYEDVLPVLDTLASRGISLGIISNWDERLKSLLEHLKLSSFFDGIIISCDVGFAKPSPVIFEQALRQLGLPPASVLHVGDSWEEDVQGARAAGLHTLLLDRSAAGAEDRIQSVGDLAVLIPSLRLN